MRVKKAGKPLRAGVRRDYSKWMERERILPGVVELLDTAKAAGLKIGLASSSKLAWIEDYLEKLCIRHYFEVICTADDVAKVKPDPELYIQALRELGVKADEAVAIEDSPNGARAAASAGMHCIIVPNELTGLLAFDAAGRSRHVESLSGIDAACLFEHGVGDND